MKYSIITISSLLILALNMQGCDNINNKLQELMSLATSNYNESMRGIEKYEATLKQLPPAQVIERFYAYWDDGNIAGMLACLKKDSIIYNDFVKLATIQKDSSKIKILSESITANVAEMLIEKFDLSPDKRQVWMSWKMKVSLSKNGEYWKITNLESSK